MYKSPFMAISKALYQVLSNSDLDMGWFDSGIPVYEIHDYYKEQEDICYGIFGGCNADVSSASDSLKLWQANMDIEIYSNYKSRKVIAEKLEGLMNVLESEWDALSEILRSEGFILVSITIGSLNVNMPLYSNIGVWQSGSAKISLNITQKEE